MKYASLGITTNDKNVQRVLNGCVHCWYASGEMWGVTALGKCSQSVITYGTGRIPASPSWKWGGIRGAQEGGDWVHC